MQCSHSEAEIEADTVCTLHPGCDADEFGRVAKKHGICWREIPYSPETIVLVHGSPNDIIGMLADMMFGDAEIPDSVLASSFEQFQLRFASAESFALLPTRV